MFDMGEGERTAAYVVNSLKGNRCEHSWGRRHFNPVLDVRESEPAACFTLNRIYSRVDGVETHCDASALQSFVDTICCLTAPPFKWSQRHPHCGVCWYAAHTTSNNQKTNRLLPVCTCCFTMKLTFEPFPWERFSHRRVFISCSVVLSSSRRWQHKSEFSLFISCFSLYQILLLLAIIVDYRLIYYQITGRTWFVQTLFMFYSVKTFVTHISVPTELSVSK